MYLFLCVTSCVVSCVGNITDDMWLQILSLSCVDMLAYYKQHTTDGVCVCMVYMVLLFFLMCLSVFHCNT